MNVSSKLELAGEQFTNISVLALDGFSLLSHYDGQDRKTASHPLCCCCCSRLAFCAATFSYSQCCG